MNRRSGSQMRDRLLGWGLAVAVVAVAALGIGCQQAPPEAGATVEPPATAGDAGATVAMAGEAGATLAMAGEAGATPAMAGEAGATPAVNAPDPVARGEQLVQSMGCNDCHTPWKMGPAGPEPDMSRMLSGHPEQLPMPPPPQLAEGPWLWVGAATNTAFAGPWGVTYTANLTPDQNTGLGIWTDEMFIRTMRHGRHMGTSRPVQPPMPWFWVGRLPDDDLKAIFAYLRTIPPVVNRVPEFQEGPHPAMLPPPEVLQPPGYQYSAAAQELATSAAPATGTSPAAPAGRGVAPSGR